MDMFDIYIAYVSWGEGGKRRPVLVLERRRGGVRVFNITTRYDGKSEVIRSKFFKVSDWQQAGLNQESYIDTNQEITLPLSSVTKPIGKLSEADAQRLIEFLAN